MNRRTCPIVSIARHGVVLFWYVMLVARSVHAVVPGPSQFAMVGIAWGQTLRLNAVAYPPSPCDVQLSFADIAGNPIGSSSTLTLVPGQGAFLDLNANLLIRPGQRVEVRPVLTPIPGGVVAGCGASAEVYDNFFGITQVIAPGLPASIGPEPHTFGLLGLTLFETLRLNVVAYPPSPCVAQLSFVDINGNPIGTTISVNLSNGEAASLDLNGNSLVMRFGQRAEVQPVVTLNPLVASACQASAEIVDQFSGRTLAYTMP